MTDVWVGSDAEIFDYDAYDDFIWYPAADLAAAWRFISEFDICNINLGLINSGELSHTYVSNDQKFILNEMNETPGFCYTYEHNDVPDSSAAYILHYQGTYGGSENHEVEFEVYDWDATAYVQFYTLETSLFTQDYFLNVPQGEQYFEDPGVTNTMKFRTYHTLPGNSGHLFRINYWYLRYA